MVSALPLMDLSRRPLSMSRPGQWGKTFTSSNAHCSIPIKSPAIGATGEPPTGKDKFGRGLGKPFTYSNRERTMRLRAVLDEAATKSDWGKPLESLVDAASQLMSKSIHSLRL